MTRQQTDWTDLPVPGLLATFAYDLVARSPPEAVVAKPPRGGAGDIKGREEPVR